MSAYQPSNVHSTAIIATPKPLISAPGEATAAGSGAVSAPVTCGCTARPSAPKAAIEPILSQVKAFCTPAPSRRPKWLIAVSSSTAPTAATCPPESVQVQPPPQPSLTASSRWRVENQGRKLPRYSPKATAMAAMPPDMMTRKAVQP